MNQHLCFNKNGDESTNKWNLELNQEKYRKIGIEHDLSSKIGETPSPITVRH
jgi:hypothetical protein